MAFGQRVLIPVYTQHGTESDQTSFSRFCVSAHRQGYREMRMIGAKEYMPCAMVLGLLEAAAHKTSATLGPILREKLRDDIFTQVLDSYEEARRQIPTADFMSNFVSKCCIFLDSEGINRSTDAVLSNIVRMCEVFKTTVDVLNEGVDEVSKIGRGVATIGIGVATTGIGVARRMCFVLYPTLTRDSFIILPCRHLQLRLLLSYSIQQAARHLAVTQGDLRETGNICKICNLKYTPDLFPFISNLASGNYILSVAQQLDPEQTDYLVCRSCHRGLEAAEVSNLCGCSETVCVNCMIIARADKYPSFCPACSKQISVTSSIEKEAAKNPNLRGFLPKDWGLGKEKGIQPNTKRCYKCNGVQEMGAYVSFGVHLNCWTCSACVLANLQTRSPCTHCHLPYDSSHPKIHEISTQIEERKAPVSQSTFVCSKCKRRAPADRQHLCCQNKKICIDCCTEDVILTHTSNISTCKDCRQNILQEMQIDVETANYECAGCHEMKTLLQIAHRCPKKGMLCPRCVKLSAKVKAVQCPHCKIHVCNKFFGMT